MEVTFKITVVCEISEIEGHGIDEEKQLAKQDLYNLTLVGALRYIQAYKVEHVEEVI